MNNYTLAIYDISNGKFILINTFPVCGCVLKVDYCTLDDYIVTLESKDNAEASSSFNNSVRTYHNWSQSDGRNKMRFRAALGTRNSGSNLSATSSSSPSPDISTKTETVIDVLEFLNLTHPLCFSLYTNPQHRRLFSCKSQNYEDLSSIIAISENSYVHIYRLCLQQLQTQSGKIAELDTLMQEQSHFFQHIYTVNFSFLVKHVCIFSQILVAASDDKVQVIRILEEKQKCEKYSSELETKTFKSMSNIELEIEKCWLTSISNARKSTATKQKVRPREIIGPTQNLDTASITLLRYADSKQMSFETLLFRKYLLTSGSIVQNIQLVRVNGFEEFGLFILRQQEIVQYSFCLKKHEVVKVSEYDFKGETAIGMSFSEQVNLLHVAFAGSGDLVTYNSRLCLSELFSSHRQQQQQSAPTPRAATGAGGSSSVALKKLCSLTRLSKVTLMGLTDVRACGLHVLVCCKCNLATPTGTSTAFSAASAITSPDSWNFYLFSQPDKQDLKCNIINQAEHKGTKKLLQMKLCSLLVFPSKDEMTSTTMQDIIICCLRIETSNSEIVPALLLRNHLNIAEALNVFQILETKELFDKNLFKLYAQQKLVNADFCCLGEDQFRWILMKVLSCSVELLFDILISNRLQDLLGVDLLILEGVRPDNFESCFIKMLYYAAHSESDSVQTLLSQLDPDELVRVCIGHPHLIFHNKKHTSLGWMVNLFCPQLYARVVAGCFLLETELTRDFRNLEIAKQVGQCSYMLALECVLHELLPGKTEEVVPDSRSRSSRAQYHRRGSVQPTGGTGYKQQQQVSSSPASATAPIHRLYLDQLVMLYHEYSFNGVDLCPHKGGIVCKQIPMWLKNLRFHSILNQFPPFDGSDPFMGSHVVSDNKSCTLLCCQSYIIRLQCLLSWLESRGLPNVNVVWSSCESQDHPAWKSLQFLLLHLEPPETREIVEIVSCLFSVARQSTSPGTSGSELMADYLQQFGTRLSVTEWRQLLLSISSAGGHNPDSVLRHASLQLPLDRFLSLLESLRQYGSIPRASHNDWVERAGRIQGRTTLLADSLEAIIADPS